MRIRKRGIMVECAACGHNSQIPPGHRLVTYIIKHYEKMKKLGKGNDGKKKKKDKRSKREQRAQEAAAQQKASRKTNEKSKTAVKEEVWYTDTSAEAQAERKRAEFEKMDHSNSAVDAILKEAEKENKQNACTTILQVFMAQKERSVREICSEVRRLQLAHTLDEPKAIKVLLESVLDLSDIKGVPKQFSDQATLFAQFTKKSPAIFLGCVEELVGVIEPKLLSRTPLILKELFDAEVLSEEDIIAWFDMPPENSWLVNKRVAVQVRQKADPLVTWLKEAESESDEEDDEESDSSDDE